MARMQTAAPARKVVAASGGGAVGGAIAEVVVYVIERWVALPANVEAAITVVIIALVAFGAGYLVPPAPDDRVVPG